MLPQWCLMIADEKNAHRQHGSRTSAANNLKQIFTVLCGATCAFYSCLLCHSWATLAPILATWHSFLGETCCRGVLATPGFSGGSLQAKLESSKLAAKAAEGAAMLGLNTGLQLALTKWWLIGGGCKASGRWVFIWTRIQLAARQTGIPSS